MIPVRCEVTTRLVRPGSAESALRAASRQRGDAQCVMGRSETLEFRRRPTEGAWRRTSGRERVTQRRASSRNWTWDDQRDVLGDGLKWFWRRRHLWRTTPLRPRTYIQSVGPRWRWRLHLRYRERSLSFQMHARLLIPSVCE